MSMIAVKAFRAALPKHVANVPGSDEELQKALNVAFATMYGVRKPVGVAMNNAVITVVCDDGTVWVIDDDEDDWEQSPKSIPGSIAASGGTEDARIAGIQALYKLNMGHDQLVHEIWRIVHEGPTKE